MKEIYYNLEYLKKQLDQNNFQLTYAKKGIFKEFNKMPVLVLTMKVQQLQAKMTK